MKLLFYFELEIGRTKFNPRHSLFSWRLCEKLNPCFGMGEMRPDPQPHPSHHNKCGVNPNHTNHSSVNFFPSLVPLCAFPSCYLC